MNDEDGEMDVNQDVAISRFNKLVDVFKEEVFEGFGGDAALDVVDSVTHTDSLCQEIRQILDEDTRMSRANRNSIRSNLTGVQDVLVKLVHETLRLSSELAAARGRLSVGADHTERRLKALEDAVSALGSGAPIAGKVPAPPPGVLAPRPDVPVVPKPKPRTKKISYASVVADRVSRVVVAPEAGSNVASAEDISKVLRQGIKPKEQGWEVVGIRERRDKKVVITTTTAEAAKKIREDPMLKKLGLKADEPARKKAPRLIIFGLPRNMQDDEIIELLAENNDILGLSLEEKRTLFKPLYKAGKKENPRVHWIIEASPDQRKALLVRGGVNLDWERCRLEDCLGISRCFRCHLYGHVRKNCHHEQVCDHCGEEGHERASCPKSDKHGVCPACMRIEARRA